ncbi:hypothetical protein BDW74DRAFT_175519 [Aspergillus multicolor]|uniref:uncharacterized protein n=1 Tax=Aspergillus multicolor TaxID=41759 RepID=UPI003CCD9209
MSSSMDSARERPVPTDNCFIYRLPVEVLAMVFQHSANLNDLHRKCRTMLPHEVYKLAVSADRDIYRFSVTCKWFQSVSNLIQSKTVILFKPDEHHRFLRTVTRDPDIGDKVRHLVFFEPPQTEQPPQPLVKRKRSRRPWYEPKSKKPKKQLDPGPIQEQEHSEEILRLLALSTTPPQRYETGTRDTLLDLLELLRWLPRLVSFPYIPVCHPLRNTCMAYCGDSKSDFDRSAMSFQTLFALAFAGFTPAQLGNKSDHSFYNLQELHLSGIHDDCMLQNVLHLPHLKTLRISPHIKIWMPDAQTVLQGSSIRELYLYRLSSFAGPFLESLLALLENLTVVHMEFTSESDIFLPPPPLRGLERHRTTLREYMLFGPPEDPLDLLPKRLEALTIVLHGSYMLDSTLQFLTAIARHTRDFRSLRRVKVERIVANDPADVELEELERVFAEAGVVFDYMPQALGRPRWRVAFS